MGARLPARNARNGLSAQKVSTLDCKNMLGETSARYLMVVKNCVVQKLNVERRPMQFICTQAEDIAFID